MPPYNVKIKNAGKTYDVVLDTDRTPADFKEEIYQKTGIPTDRMKVMIKGGMLKDETEWKKVAPKEGMTFTVIGTAGELPKPPALPVKFLEDMDDAELANALNVPTGMTNLGNTCYMSATIQAMNAIPELQLALQAAKPVASLPRALTELFTTMSRTTDSVTPSSFLMFLRQAQPQFAERARNNMIFAQQDAEECWSRILESLRDIPAIPGPAGAPKPQDKFVESFLSGTLVRELKCAEAPEEEPTVSSERVYKLECNINANTNYMHSGISDALTQTIVKRSPTLGRDADYAMRSRFSRLPTYLTVHMVRFTWRQDINKKAKIMRQVKFPTEYDALELTTDDLKAKLQPVSRRLLELEKERRERLKVRKRTKARTEAAVASATANAAGEAPMEVDEAAAPAAEAEGGELKEESFYRDQERKELEGLVDPAIKADFGASQTGLYDLVAIITHKGAAADAGHYIAFVKKSVFHPKTVKAPEPGEGDAGSSTALPGRGGVLDEDDEDWYKFDDEKVSHFPAEKLQTLSGGGEDASAYVLLYRTKDLA
ncbi:cysteine proteinase [Peniophora sp. CONT]|nr:cysteine proteinase [Peniophora sp. CONT]